MQFDLGDMILYCTTSKCGQGLLRIAKEITTLEAQTKNDIVEQLKVGATGSGECAAEICEVFSFLYQGDNSNKLLEAVANDRTARAAT